MRSPSSRQRWNYEESDRLVSASEIFVCLGPGPNLADSCSGYLLPRILGSGLTRGERERIGLTANSCSADSPAAVIRSL